jgi:hypothetical protein
MDYFSDLAKAKVLGEGRGEADGCQNRALRARSQGSGQTKSHTYFTHSLLPPSRPPPTVEELRKIVGGYIGAIHQTTLTAPLGGPNPRPTWDRGSFSRDFPPPWRADKIPGRQPGDDPGTGRGVVTGWHRHS